MWTWKWGPILGLLLKCWKWFFCEKNLFSRLTDRLNHSQNIMISKLMTFTIKTVNRLFLTLFRYFLNLSEAQCTQYVRTDNFRTDWPIFFEIQNVAPWEKVKKIGTIRFFDFRKFHFRFSSASLFKLFVTIFGFSVKKIGRCANF